MAMLVPRYSGYAEVSKALQMPMGAIGPTRNRGLSRLRRDGQLRRLL
jgi:hypothetical protein